MIFPTVLLTQICCLLLTRGLLIILLEYILRNFALANVIGEECVQLYNLLPQNDLETVRLLQLLLIAPNQVVSY